MRPGRSAGVRLLQNPLYLGQVRHRGETYAGEHVAIIEEPVWQKAQTLLSQERARRTSREANRTVSATPSRKAVQRRETPERVPRIARLMALALKFEQMLQQGVVSDYTVLVELGRISQPRLTQIMNLRNLAPDIQEQILFLTSREAEQCRIYERSIRRLSSLLHWKEQRAQWLALTSASGKLS